MTTHEASGAVVEVTPGPPLALAPPPRWRLPCDGASDVSSPLVFSPGTKWNYSFGIDVLGRIVEVVSGQTLDRFLDSSAAKHERRRGPLVPAPSQP